MSNRRSPNDGSGFVAVVLLGVIFFVGTLFARLLLGAWNAVDPYAPRSLYEPKQARMSNNRYWILWIVLVGTVTTFAFSQGWIVVTEGNKPFLFIVPIAGIFLGYLFQPRLSKKFSELRPRQSARTPAANATSLPCARRPSGAIDRGQARGAGRSQRPGRKSLPCAPARSSCVFPHYRLVTPASRAGA